MKLPLPEYILSITGVLALVSLLLRLAFSGLARIYKFFFCYLTVDLVQTLAPFFIRFDSDLYGDIFLVTEGLMVAFYVLIIFELYTAVFRQLKGIGRAAQRFTAFALVGATFAALMLRTVIP